MTESEARRAARWQYVIVWRYGPLGLIVLGLGMLGYGASGHPSAPVSLSLIPLGFASVVAGVVLPRIERRFAAGARGVAAELLAVHELDPPTYTASGLALAPPGAQGQAAQIKLGDVWDALESAGFRPGQAAMGKRFLEGPEGRTILLHQRGFFDWAVVSDELLAQLASWGVHPVPSGRYPVPPDPNVDPANVRQPYSGPTLPPRGSVAQ